jgi:hypothetical protein
MLPGARFVFVAIRTTACIGYSPMRFLFSFGEGNRTVARTRFGWTEGIPLKADDRRPLK